MSPGSRTPNRAAVSVPQSLPCIRRTAEVEGRRLLVAIRCMSLKRGRFR
jgi:hypothetical protein